MDNHVQVVEILVADDDEDDRFLMEEALEEKDFRAVYFVEDEEELMDYLYHRGQYSSLSSSPRPNLILLDLNMPRKDGREALKEIKADPQLRKIPVVVMTTSKAEEDILRTYNLGVNSYIIKPTTFESMVEMMNTLGGYWFDIVQLPDRIREDFYR
ncbi:MAG: response regulator [Prochloron sp. SP5CPC1]|nr:response regulator [Candidatus Paraprochloron terpiosi SP5CPC1]